MWASALVSLYWRKKFLWPSFRYELIYGYNHVSLGVSIMLCPVRKIVVLSSHHRFLTVRMVLGNGFLLTCLKSKQRVVCYSYGTHATIALVSVSSQALYLGKINNYFFPLRALWKLASSDESSKSVPVYVSMPKTQVCVVFSNRITIKFWGLCNSIGNILWHLVVYGT